MTTPPAPSAEPSTLDDEVVAALTPLRDWRRAEPGVMETKRQALAKLYAAGIAKRRVHQHVRSLLADRGWSPADIDSVGISAPQVRADLGRVLH